MGRHKAWRVQAKKARRKRIRQQQAKLRDELLDKEKTLRERSPRYQVWKTEQGALEIFQRQEEARLQAERHMEWENDEKRAQEDWKALQERISKARENKAAQDLLIREEWEVEQKRVKEIEAAATKVQEDKQRKQDELMQQIDDFISKGGNLPAAANVSTETNPNMPVCPFFSKTGACRFLDRCSREFYDDVLPEFETCGRVVQFKVCCNFEPHLRGNVYVEYESARDAVRAFQKFHGRWYGGRQLNSEFTCVQSWKSAICGLFFRGCCPKGKSCNFLHVFRNPGNEFKHADFDRNRFRHRSTNRSMRSRSRSPSRHRSHRSIDRNNWRWSESPEPVLLTENAQTNGCKSHSSKRNSHSKDRGSKGRESSRDSGRSSRESKSRTRSKRHKDPSWSSERKEKDSDRNGGEMASDRDMSSKDTVRSRANNQDNSSEGDLRLNADLSPRCDGVVNEDNNSVMNKDNKGDSLGRRDADSQSGNGHKSESSKKRKTSKKKSHRKEKRRKSRS